MTERGVATAPLRLLVMPRSLPSTPVLASNGPSRNDAGALLA